MMELDDTHFFKKQKINCICIWELIGGVNFVSSRVCVARFLLHLILYSCESVTRSLS